MGKTKQEKKFDRNVEISAPILDPEIIKQIHSPPKDQKRDIRHGGFKALLSDLNSQDSTDELTPITENHLPSYIGISCAVSGYSNYCSYGRKPLDQSITTRSATETKNHKLTTTTSSRQTPNRSQTNSPLAVRIEQHNIHHVTIDKSNINSVDQERKELTEKLTASAAERRLSPSPIPPTVDDRHHGAYVGARYCPMPEPSKLVNKHIPLLGIDDDLDPDEVVVEDVNKVEKKIASLYGENFVEDWKESMSHKSKKELNDETHEEKVGPVNLRESVSLKPPPPKAPQPEEPIQVDIPTPNVKVLAGVEKQFLTRLLTDENPPMPKSPSPQPTSPKFTSPTRTTKNQDSFQTSTVSPSPPPPPRKEQTPPVSPSLIHATTEFVPNARDEHDHFEPKEIAPTHYSTNPLESPRHSLIDDTQSHATGHTSSEPLVTFDDSPAVPESDGRDNLGHSNLIDGDDDNEKVLDTPHVQHADYLHEAEISNSQQEEPAALIEEAHETAALDNLADQEVQSARSSSSKEPHRSRSSSSSSNSSSSSDSSQNQAKSPESQISSSTVERAPLDKHEQQQQQQSGCFESNEEHIEYEIEAQSQPVNNESSPVKVPAETLDDESLPAKRVVAQDTENLVSFTPEPASIIELTSETNNNNNFEDQIKGTESDTATGSMEQVVDVAGDGDGDGGDDDDDATAAVKQSDDDAPFGAGGMDTIVTNEQGEQKLVSAAGGGGGETTEDSKDGHYFLDLLRMEESFILERVRLAEQLLAEHGDGMDEERLGRIHSAIGKANLLINKKCNQFRELCEKSISGDASDQYAVLNDDLAGFWDMISIQIADVRKSLENP